MCGIAGFIDFSQNNLLNGDAILREMTDSLAHRGPDGTGYKVIRDQKYFIGLGHRRLSIIELSDLGAQPMVSIDENIVVVFNGEIYNYKEIRNELIQRGYIFKTNSDTETIIAGYIQWGIKFLERAIGMFAIVIYDRKKNKVFFIRDRAGVKPLYYYHDQSIILFGSELKALIKHPSFEKKIEINSVATYLQYGYILAPYSIYKKTFKLLPGNYLEIDLLTNNTTLNEYWSVPKVYKNSIPITIDYRELIVETEKLLKSACEYRMVSDVPVGVFLSGGYDSSMVTALLQKERTEKLKTFSIGFRNSKYNEANFAKDVANHLGTNHTEYYCEQKDMLEIIPILPYYYDEPFADSSSIPTILVSRLARKEVTVSISADGGDEVFGGYPRHLNALNYSKFIQSIPDVLKNKISKHINYFDSENSFLNKHINNYSTKFNKAKELLKAKNPVEMMINSCQVFTKNEISNIFNDTVTRQNNNFDTVLDFTNDSINEILAIDYITYLPDDILTKVDRATMSTSLEGREPLLDHRLIEMMAQIKGDSKIVNKNLKKITKDITHKYIPYQLMNRPKKGFGIPMEIWLKNDLKDLIEEYINEEKLKEHNIFNIELVLNLKLNFLKSNTVNPNKIWFILMFQMWYKQWFNNKNN